MGFSDLELRRRIYCHRGQWETKTDQNSKDALIMAAANGFGFETDIRDSFGNLAISHDAFSVSDLVLSDLLNLNAPIALNIKSDGLLRDGIHEISKIAQNSGSFVFDGSIPEMLHYRRAGLPHALRLSEYESTLSWQSEYVWLDAFETDWWLETDLLQRFSERHFVVVVSPELHARESLRVWDAVAKEIINSNPNVGLCTDLPMEFLRMIE
jgi:hypothetical protein